MNIKEVYNKFASDYHYKRKNTLQNHWNEYLDFPMIAALVQEHVKSKNVLILVVVQVCLQGAFAKWVLLFKELINLKSSLSLRA